MQKLQTVNAETLLYEPLEKPSFVVDSLIPTGLSLFCGSQKIGKSWLMLKLCLCVSQGIPLWDMPTMEGDVLYLCLEDTFCRIQDRLFRLTDEASGRLHFAVASCKLSDGLIVQLEDYLKDYPDSRLIVIDTLQKVRTASKDNAYASDYGDISLIKDFADRHSLAVIVVHHIRKQNDSDVFNKVSGTTGLTGSADATFVLEKEKRASDTAKLYVTGRDTPYQEYTLRFRDCRWELVERKTQEQLAKETIPDVLFRLVDFMRDKEEWIGTATELLAAMGETETIPTVITKWLNEYRTTFLSENRICYQYSRRKDGRRIALARRAGDSGDGGSESEYEDLKKYALEDRLEIKRELEIIQPDIIVCGNNLSLLKLVLGEELQNDDTWDNMLALWKDTLVLDYYHPAVHYPNRVNYYALMAICDVARKKYGTPVWSEQNEKY